MQGYRLMITRSSPSSKSLSTSGGALHVVGVGASAGGLESLESLFHAVPVDSGMAFVVIQPLSPDVNGHIQERLARQTAIPVHRVENGMRVEPDAIYLLPAKKETEISEGRLILTERSANRSLPLPIDRFFRSLANDCGRYAIGVILSGTGSDGSLGGKDIRNAGGLVIVQDETTARFDAMTINTKATGTVGAVLPPPAIAEALVRHSKDGGGRKKMEKLPAEQLADGNMAGTDQILQLLSRKYGTDFSQHNPSSVDGVVITDPRIKGNPITYVNQGFLKLTGYEKEEVIGRNCRFLQGKETDSRTIQQISDSLRKGIALRVTLLNYRKNGDAFWNDLQITPILDERGEVIQFVGIQHDVSEKIHTQQMLKNANEAAEIANETKSAFLAMMSHELRTPLTAILGFADMLKSESTDPTYLEKVDTIKRNGTYLLTLLNDILDLSEVETGKLRFVREDVHIPTVMAEVESLMQIRAGEMRVPLRFEFGDHLPENIKADAIRIRQILVNLISNSLKFSDSGEVVVSTFTCDEDEIALLKISVKDFGIGISKNQLAGLFTPFNQANKPTNIGSDGTGLGLSISKRLAEGIGGVIHVDSELGKGSCFTLSLPIEKTGSKRLEIGAPPFTQSFQNNRNDVSDSTLPSINGKILLADDRRDIWRVGKYFLEKCGAAVTVVENGRQAVEAVIAAAAENAPFSLVLMDMQMPIMTGHEAVRELRRLGFELPIIALTADAMEGEREACIKMGCNEYFPKPIDGPRLMNSIASLIQQPW